MVFGRNKAGVYVVVELFVTNGSPLIRLNVILWKTWTWTNILLPSSIHFLQTISTPKKCTYGIDVHRNNWNSFQDLLLLFYLYYTSEYQQSRYWFCTKHVIIGRNQCFWHREVLQICPINLQQNILNDKKAYFPIPVYSDHFQNSVSWSLKRHWKNYY